MRTSELINPAVPLRCHQFVIVNISASAVCNTISMYLRKMMGFSRCILMKIIDANSIFIRQMNNKKWQERARMMGTCRLTLDNKEQQRKNIVDYDCCYYTLFSECAPH